MFFCGFLCVLEWEVLGWSFKYCKSHLNSYPMKTELSTSSTQWQNGITKAIIPVAESVSDLSKTNDTVSWQLLLVFWIFNHSFLGIFFYHESNQILEQVPWKRFMFSNCSDSKLEWMWSWEVFEPSFKAGPVLRRVLDQMTSRGLFWFKLFNEPMWLDEIGNVSWASGKLNE